MERSPTINDVGSCASVIKAEELALAFKGAWRRLIFPLCWVAPICLLSLPGPFPCNSLPLFFFLRLDLFLEILLVLKQGMFLFPQVVMAIELKEVIQFYFVLGMYLVPLIYGTFPSPCFCKPNLVFIGHFNGAVWVGPLRLKVG